MRLTKTKKQQLLIPDNDLLGIASTMNIESEYSIKALKLIVGLKHSYSPDLSIELKAPNGEKKVVLSPGDATNIDDFVFPVEEEKMLSDGTQGEWILRLIDSGMKDEGSLEFWKLDFNCEDEARNLIIEDQSVLALERRVDAPGALNSIDLSFDIDHQHVGDLVVKLESPSGKSRILHNRTGSNATKVNVSFNTYELSEFKGEKLGGSWWLIIEDHLKGDTGKLISWNLELN